MPMTVFMLAEFERRLKISPTLHRFPDPFVSASNPPGPILLLLDFRADFAAPAGPLAAARAPRSAVIFS